MPELRVYGCSDDLVEFEGVFTEEYNVYQPATFLVTIDVADDRAQFEVHARYWAEWELSVKSCSNWSNYPMNVRFDQRPDYDGDPMIIFELDDDAKVRVVRVGGNDGD
ncbi:Uncharacterised protein [Mycobacteroides abscessus subsp. abscessus]|uniref:hypothetical protein n=1 Tax=Mycobacteroides abscessus TaxID=36809 RepID=UPI0009A774A4|nr:hypothetical protein [Mycobacteroides abscessus]SKU46625.1 Uncharacterised protein [Mycobacteroides abscessus subsp. abscessus]